MLCARASWLTTTVAAKLSAWIPARAVALSTLSSDTVGVLRSVPSLIIWAKESAKPSRSDRACASALIRVWFCWVRVLIRATLGSRDAAARSVTSCLVSMPDPKPRLLMMEVTMAKYPSHLLTAARGRF